ncbi:putative oxidoreductase C-terminal domain-containing protein [Sphingobacterium faecale]|uniref:Oxidoreductase n=1 Tax=Sphingobacterium faecale TaxID=2803775 RepID=A0ABS1R3R3_9SPHI|nr:putative oxidoreductase C-terminal domain-containing protein [Sphingobacterium faecale]MBL1408652.1 oxidoreductase [Sphingobacterium faecale]
MKLYKKAYLWTALCLLGMGCGQSQSSKSDEDLIKLVLIQPEHFHAALVQKYKNAEIEPKVHLFADTENSAEAYRDFIQQYNSRRENPTDWKVIAYYGHDFLNKAFNIGNVVVLAGDNQRKIEFISQSLEKGKDVFADKPLVINTKGYDKLERLLTSSSTTPLIFDIMTERYDVKNLIVKSLLNDTQFSGGINKDESGHAIKFNSTHHFIKDVSGKPLIRPAMFYNTLQQGEGLVDVTTHYIDLVYWMLSSEQTVDLKKDIKLDSSFRWYTRVTKRDFEKSTGLKQYPSMLKSSETNEGDLAVYSNGKLCFNFKGVPVSVAVQWNVESLDKRGDQFSAEFNAKKFRLEIKPDSTGVMSVFVIPKEVNRNFEGELRQALGELKDLPGLDIMQEQDAYKISVPKSLYLSHEDHFAKVLNQFVLYRRANALPDWEKSFMLAKYYLTTQALAKAKTIGYEED